MPVPSRRLPGRQRKRPLSRLRDRLLWRTLTTLSLILCVHIAPSDVYTQDARNGRTLLRDESSTALQDPFLSTEERFRGERHRFTTFRVRRESASGSQAQSAPPPAGSRLEVERRLVPVRGGPLDLGRQIGRLPSAGFRGGGISSGPVPTGASGVARATPGGPVPASALRPGDPREAALAGMGQDPSTYPGSVGAVSPVDVSRPEPLVGEYDVLDTIVVEIPPSAFERQLERYSHLNADVAVTQFGYDIFGRPQPEPVDAPVGDDYVLGTGDRVLVSLWGNVNLDHEGTIDRDGQLRVPQLGPIPLKGLTLEGAERLLRRRFDRLFKNYEIQVNLGRLRDMPVHVMGRVALPGRHRVYSIASLFDALATAGGITKDGSLRRIRLRRPGEVDRSIDLYDYLIEGQIDIDVTLSPRDVILVPSVGPRVGVVGRVLRPAIYEIEDQESSLATLLEMAGGYARLADLENIQIETASTNGLSIRSVDLTRLKASDVPLGDGDVVIVQSAGPRLDNVVYLLGNVSQPGRYAFTAGMRVSDLVTGERLVDAGFWLDRLPPEGTDEDFELPEPYLDYALVRRIHPRTLGELLIPFDLGKAILDRDPRENYPLQSQDTVIVFSRDEFDPPRSVFVSGAVNKPGKVDHFEGMRIRDLIRMAGGLLPEAHLSSAMLTRVFPDQEGAHIEHLEVDLERIMEGADEENVALQPEDSLVIKRVPEYRQTLRVLVEGEVKHPGLYSVIPGERLSDVLERVGGFTDAAYLPAARLYRESVREIQAKRLEESLQRLELQAKLNSQSFAAEASVIAGGSPAAGVAAEQARIERLVETIRETPPEGRMVIQLKPPGKLRGTVDDIELDEGDRLIIPRRPGEINVIGAVFNQTALLYQEGLTVGEYIDQCGGVNESAEPAEIFVIRANGQADSARSVRRGFRWDSSRGRFTRGGLLNETLYPGDTVVVPYDVKPKLSRLGLATTVTQIIFQAAMATGVVVALL